MLHNLSIVIFTNGQDKKKINLFHIFHFTVMEDLLLGVIISLSLQWSLISDLNGQK